MPREFRPEDLPTLFLTAHEKECALAAIAALIERATDRNERRELRQWFREVVDAPLIEIPGA